MRCPFCSADETRVIDSRLTEEGDAVRRRRECEVCRERFTTFERAELRLPQVIKSDGRREPFVEAKLRAGLSRALEKRPVTAEAVEAMVGRVRHKLIACGEREIPSRRIGEWVMEELKEIDPVAYVRFASVYRSFEDVDAFREEVQRLQAEPSSESRRKQLRLLPEEPAGGGATPAPSGRRPATGRKP
ncbi:MAG: transcriptional regulator NrdR [Sulfurifustaceae bacterium]